MALIDRRLNVILSFFFVLLILLPHTLQYNPIIPVGRHSRATSHAANHAVPMLRTFALHAVDDNVSPPASPPPPQNAPHLYLIDDEPSLLSAVSSYLESIPYTVTSFPCGTTALEALDATTKSGSNLPALIISDVNMPEMSGLELLRSVRSHPSRSLSGLPFILLTARGMTEDRIEGYKAECDGYISKPFDPEELRAVVESLLKRKRGGGGGGEEASIESVQESLEELKEVSLRSVRVAK